MAVDKPLGERIAAIEKENAIGAGDRISLWEVINELRPLLARLGTQVSLQTASQAAILSRIEDLCKSKEAKIAIVEYELGKRLTALETKIAVTDGQRNLAFGMAGVIMAGVGGVAMWVAQKILWPIIAKALNLE